jgi:hypothetical protein
MKIALLVIAALAVSGAIFGRRWQAKKRSQQQDKVNRRTIAANGSLPENSSDTNKKVQQRVVVPEASTPVPTWMKTLPKAIKRALLEEHRSTALIYALLLDPHNMPIRAQQIAYLKKIENPLISEHINGLFTTIAVRIEDRWRLPIMGQALMRLQKAPIAAREHLLQCAASTLEAVTAASWQVPLAYLILEHHLQTPSGSAKLGNNRGIENCWSESLVVLGTVARAGHHKPEAIKHAFQAGVLRLPHHSGQDLALPKECDWQMLQACLEKLQQTKLVDRQVLVTACAEVVATNKQVSNIEVDLLSTISIVLDCPLPSVLNGTPVKRVSEKTELEAAR